MPQVFHVVRCYACQVFQVQLVKKIPKWVCKMCGEKQSLKKEYGHGSSFDCRRHVQQLNMSARDCLQPGSDIQESVAAHLYSPQCRRSNDEYQTTSERRAEFSAGRGKVETSLSKWHMYIDGNSIEKTPWSSLQEENTCLHIDNAEITTSKPLCHKRGGRKYGEWKGRIKRKREDLNQGTNVDMWNPSALPQNRSICGQSVNTSHLQMNVVPDCQYPSCCVQETSTQSISPEVKENLSKESGFGSNNYRQRQKWIQSVESGTLTSRNVTRQSREATCCSSNKWGKFLQDDSDDNEDVVTGKTCFQVPEAQASTVSSYWNRKEQTFQDTCTSRFTATVTTVGVDGDITETLPNILQETFQQKDSLVGFRTLEREENGNKVPRGSNNVFLLDDEDTLNDILKDDWS